MQIQPRYTPENCQAAYQLNWSLSVFGSESLPSPASTIEELRSAIASDHLKILEFNYKPPKVAQFFVSSRPNSKPSDVVRVLKGRWQYLSRPKEPIEFRRNYRITSVGSAKAEVLDAYIERQPIRHAMADHRVSDCCRIMCIYWSGQESRIRRMTSPWCCSTTWPSRKA